MSMQTKTIGRMPIDHGPYDPQLAYGKKFQCTLFGCAWESLHDNNNTAPAVWDGGDVITPNMVDWKKVSGSYEAWLMNKDKPATTGTTGAYPYNGMGRVVIPKKMVNGVNTLTHEAFEDSEGNDRENTIYVIRYDFTLGEDITVPSNCILEFDGGSIGNTAGNTYSLSGNFSFNDVMYHIFRNITFVKNEVTLCVDFLRPEWFGAKGDAVWDNNTAYIVSGTDDSAAFNQCYQNANKCRVQKIKLSACTYFLASPLVIDEGNVDIEGVWANKKGFPESTRSVNVSGRLTSCIIIGHSATSAISIDGYVQYGFSIRNINFYNDIKNNKTAIGINNISTNPGPLSPFVVEYCHFQGFAKAISFGRDDLGYNVYGAIISHNSFGANDFCVYFKESQQGLFGNDTIGYTASIKITDNQMSGYNTHPMYLGIGTGPCIIKRNLLEGNYTFWMHSLYDAEHEEDTVSDSVNYIYASNSADIDISDNYCEGISKHPFKIIVTDYGKGSSNDYGQATITISGNTHFSRTGSSHSDNTIPIVCASDNTIITLKHIQRDASIVISETDSNNLLHIILDSEIPLSIISLLCTNCIISSNSIPNGVYYPSQNFYNAITKCDHSVENLSIAVDTPIHDLGLVYHTSLELFVIVALRGYLYNMDNADDFVYIEKDDGAGNKEYFNLPKITQNISEKICYKYEYNFLITKVTGFTAAHTITHIKRNCNLEYVWTCIRRADVQTLDMIYKVIENKNVTPLITV